MLAPICNAFRLREGTDYIISEKGYITCLYFKDLLKAQNFREQLANKASLKEIKLAVISKVLRRPNTFGYFFFISEERII
jgi:hypothetical protein